MILRVLVGALIYGVTFGIGVIVSAFMVGMREDKRSIHDFVAGTYVTYALMNRLKRANNFALFLHKNWMKAQHITNVKGGKSHEKRRYHWSFFITAMVFTMPAHAAETKMPSTMSLTQQQKKKLNHLKKKYSKNANMSFPNMLSTASCRKKKQSILNSIWTGTLI